MDELIDFDQQDKEEYFHLPLAEYFRHKIKTIAIAILPAVREATPLEQAGPITLKQ